MIGSRVITRWLASLMKPRPEPGRDHRRYVGGAWDEIGRLQFDFLVSRGLRPHHTLLDVGCGSLRAGRLLIPYLHAGGYLGLDKEESLIRAGLAKELDASIRAQKKPRFVVSRAFEFERFGRHPDFALAQSLFTHLTPRTIELCLRKLRPWIREDGVFYCTWFVGDGSLNPPSDNDHTRFEYSLAEIERFGSGEGFETELIGEWGHPRGQQMVAFRPI